MKSNNFTLSYNQAWLQFLLSGILLFLLSFSLPVAAQSPASKDAERILIETLRNVQSLQMDQAILQAQELVEKYPDYDLAQMLSADLLAIKGGDFGLLAKVEKRYPRTTTRLKQEAEVRWQHAHSDSNLVENLLQNSVLKVGEQQHVIVANLAKNRLFVYENKAGQLSLLANYYISMGTAGSGKRLEGDRKTPVGVYHIVDWVPGQKLADMYGFGALPLNYPNIWDKSLGRTGYGIWLHGTPSDTFSRPPQSSQGCVVLNNQEMSSLVADFDVGMGTPVLLIDQPNINLANADDQVDVLAEIYAWLQEQGQDFEWSQVSVYQYPSEKGLYYATFPDAQAPENLVHQYWQRNSDGGWQLVLQDSFPKAIKERI